MTIREVVEHALTVQDVESDFGGVKSYEWLRAAVMAAFNPPDDDAAEEQILTEAIIEAAAFIEAQPCLCIDPDSDPCARCDALGRIGDRPADR